MTSVAAFLFDLDGTLVDSVYNHVRAWHLALREEGIDLSVWRIHRKIGMSGGLFVNQLKRELGIELDEATIQRCRAPAGVERPWPAVGDRDQRTDGDRKRKPQKPGRRPRTGSRRHPRPGELRQAGPGSVRRGGAPARRWNPGFVRHR